MTTRLDPQHLVLAQTRAGVVVQLRRLCEAEKTVWYERLDENAHVGHFVSL